MQDPVMLAFPLAALTAPGLFFLTILSLLEYSYMFPLSVRKITHVTILTNWKIQEQCFYQVYVHNNITSHKAFCLQLKRIWQLSRFLLL